MYMETNLDSVPSTQLDFYARFYKTKALLAATESDQETYLLLADYAMNKLVAWTSHAKDYSTEKMLAEVNCDLIYAKLPEAVRW